MTPQPGSTLTALTDAVIAFRDARDWKKYHNPKDVAISLVLEATELLELFQWCPEVGTSDLVDRQKGAIEEELADVFYWVLLLCRDLDIDIAKALQRKLAVNEQKYPIEQFRGSSRKYDSKDGDG